MLIVCSRLTTLTLESEEVNSKGDRLLPIMNNALVCCFNIYHLSFSLYLGFKSPFERVNVQWFKLKPEFPDPAANAAKQVSES